MDTPKQDNLYKWLALIVVIFGTFMAILDTSIVNIAIPKMMAVFGVSTDQIQWVLTAYMLTMGAVIPLTGYLGDTFGTKKVYVWALAAFTIGSALCGLSWSNSSMIVARIIQALGGGMIMPTSMAIIYQVVPQEERGMALGFWGIAAMAAPAIGPTLSGYIVQYLDWRLIFTLNIPIGILGVVLATLLLKDSPRKAPKGFDYLGFITSTIGLVSILYVLGEGSTIDWNDFTIVFLLILGVFSLILFVALELTHPDPLLDLRLFKNIPFSLSIVISGVLNIALFGGIFLVPLYLQNLRGFTAMQAGMLMFPSAIASGIMMPISGKLFDKFGAKPVVIPGLAILIWSTYHLSTISMDTSSSTIMWILIFRGFGLGMAMMPATTSGMNAVPQQLVARASALSNVCRQIAGSLGVTILTTIMVHQQTVNYARLSEQVSSFNPNTMEAVKYLQGMMSLNGYSVADAQGMSIFTLFGLVQKQAFLLALNDTLLVSTIIAVISLPLAFLIRGKLKSAKKTGEPHVVME